MSSRRLLVMVSVGLSLALVGLVLPRYATVSLPDEVLTIFTFVVVAVAIPILFMIQLGLETDRPSLSNPEQPLAGTVPGDRFDALLEDASTRRRPTDSHSLTRIHERLRTVATDTLVAHSQLTREEATTQLEDGSWTDDPVAGAFLRDSTGSGGPERGPFESIDSGPESVRTVVERTVATLVRTTGRTPTSRPSESLGTRVFHLLRGTQTETTEPKYTVAPSDRTVRLTNRWYGISALALFGIGAGVGLEEPGILLVGAVGVGYAAYARTTFQPPIDLSATRTLETETPQIDESVTVTVTVRNDGSQPLPDVRLIDGVPAAVGVTDGSPRYGTTIPAETEISFEYTIRARRGHHEFGPLRVLARDLAETVEHDLTVSAESSFTCRPTSTGAPSPQLRQQLAQFVGQIPTTTGGDGLEFHSTRAYRRGDPMARIDWNRLARTGSLSTVSFREERATTVILVVDSRKSASVASRSDLPTAADRSATAAAQSVSPLRQEGNAVGLAALSPTSCWIHPRSDRTTDAHITETLTTHSAFTQQPSPDYCDTAAWIDEFRSRFSKPAQVLFISPLSDGGARRTARELEEYGYPVTVLSPDPTALDTVGNQLAALERAIRLDELRRAGVRVVDWESERSLEGALLDASRRWSR